PACRASSAASSSGPASDVSSIDVMMLLREEDRPSMIERAERPRQRPGSNSQPARARLLAAALLAVSCAPALRPPVETGKRAADPRQGSRHNRGCAVDLSLYDLASGREVEMPSGYDEMTERAYPDYAGGPPEARARRAILRAAMEAEGFTVYSSEWWHYDYKD